MHATSGFPWWIEALRWYLIVGVPLIMLAVLVDSLRRRDVAFKRGRYERFAFAGSAVVLAALLGAGFIWPHVSLLGLAAILMIPGSVFLGTAYLLRVVYRIAEPASLPAPDAGTVPPSDPTEES